MRSSLFSIMNRLKVNIRCCHHLYGTRSLSTGGIANNNNLYSSIIFKLDKPGASVLPELEKWTGKGVKLKLLFDIIRDLRTRKRHAQALEVSEWIGNAGVCKFTPSNHAVHLDLISRVHGVDSAESYFNNLRDQEKTIHTHGALLHCYVRECLTDKSLSYLEKIKEMGLPFDSLIYNNIMALYMKTNKFDKVPKMLDEMKNNGVSPDKISYSMCLTSYLEISDVDGMEKLLQEMEEQPTMVVEWNTYAMVANSHIKSGNNEKALVYLKKAEEKLKEKDTLGYNHLITLYASLRNKSEMLRLWNLKKECCTEYHNMDYITMLGSWAKLGDFEEAEKLLEEWESSTSNYDFRVPNTLLIGYCNKGLVEKAQKMLTDTIQKGKTPIPNSWGIIAFAYVNNNEMEKALECMKLAIKLRGIRKTWRPNPKAIAAILSWLGDNGQVEEVENFVDSLKNVIRMDRNVYHALIKANVREGKAVDELLESMKSDKIEENEETKKILELQIS